MSDPERDKLNVILSLFENSFIVGELLFTGLHNFKESVELNLFIFGTDIAGTDYFVLLLRISEIRSLTIVS